MAFIFTPERDPRRERMAQFNAGDKVKYSNMTMPAEVLSGPHKSPGNDRYLIRKADGNVSLVPVRDIERIVPRIEQMAETLSVAIYGCGFASLDYHRRSTVARTATRALNIADSTRGQD